MSEHFNFDQYLSYIKTIKCDPLPGGITGSVCEISAWSAKWLVDAALNMPEAFVSPSEDGSFTITLPSGQVTLLEPHQHNPLARRRTEIETLQRIRKEQRHLSVVGS